MALRRDPDIVALDQGGGVFRLSARTERARAWLAANVKNAKRDGVVVVPRCERCACLARSERRGFAWRA